MSLLISSLRQGRFNLNVSSVGGLTITQAATSREAREGLYDWKFFNAIVSPDEHSFDHMKQVIHDKRTMFKILQVVELINGDLEKLLRYALKHLWRAPSLFSSSCAFEIFLMELRIVPTLNKMYYHFPQYLYSYHYFQDNKPHETQTVLTPSSLFLLMWRMVTKSTWYPPIVLQMQPVPLMLM